MRIIFVFVYAYFLTITSSMELSNNMEFWAGWAFVRTEHLDTDRGYVVSDPGVFHSGNIIGGRKSFYSCNFEGSNEFYVFGGHGLCATITSCHSTKGYLNDLWVFDFTKRQWSFLLGNETLQAQRGVYGPRNVYGGSYPGGRNIGKMSCIDNPIEGKILVAIGGYGYNSETNTILDDVWYYSIAKSSWKWTNGTDKGNAPDAILREKGSWGMSQIGGIYSFVQIPITNEMIVIFGGYHDSKQSNDVILYDINTQIFMWKWGSYPISLSTSVFGAKGEYDGVSKIGRRLSACGWHIDNGDEFFIYGGDGEGISSSLWMFSLTRNKWKWMSGPGFMFPVLEYHSYGDYGKMKKGDFPNARSVHSTTYFKGNIFVFGGYDLGINYDFFSDLTMYNIDDDDWYFLYGIEGVRMGRYANYSATGDVKFDLNNAIGARKTSTLFVYKEFDDGNGYPILSIFGGEGYNDYEMNHISDVALLKPLYKCNEIIENSDLVCSKNGKCMGYDKCLCNNNYHGRDCEVKRCGDYYSNETEVCGRRGICEKENKCTCFEGYIGRYCEMAKCFSLTNLNSSVCFSHGVCGERDFCKCFNGWSGPSCGERDSLYLLADYSYVIVPILLLLLFLLIAVIIVVSIVVIISSVVLKQKKKLDKIGKIDNIDLVLEEQKANRQVTGGLKPIKFSSKEFVIEYSDVKLIKWIAQGGGLASVFLGTYQGREVAVKLTQNITLSTDNNDRIGEFEKEISLLVSLRHPNVIRVWGIIQKAPNLIGYVMEFCSNGTIFNFITNYKAKNKSQIKFSEKLRFMKEICLAMQFIHSKNILHRDLKCDNVLITKEHSVKVMDFGLSRFYAIDEVTLTKRIGTSANMSPEMVLGKKYDMSTDVYSFAIMMYEIFAEEKAYGDIEDRSNIEFKIASNPYFRPKISLVKNIPKPLVHLIKTCWSEKPSKRYSFKKIIEMIENWEKKKEFDVIIYVRKRGESDEECEDFVIYEKKLNELKEIVYKREGRKVDELKMFVKGDSGSVEKEIRNDEDVKEMVKEDTIVIYEYKHNKNNGNKEVLKLQKRIKKLEEENAFLKKKCGM